MTTRIRRAGAGLELTLATGLVWGHLKARQFDTALTLARGCLQVWPGDAALALMAAYARLEWDGRDGIEPAGLPALPPQADGAAPWLRLLRRRARPAAAAHAASTATAAVAPMAATGGHA